MGAASAFIASLTQDLPERILAATRLQRLFVNTLMADPLYQTPEVSLDWKETPHLEWNADLSSRQHFHRVVGLVSEQGQMRFRSGLELAIIDAKDVVLVLTYDEWACGVSLPGMAQIDYFALTTTTPALYECDLLVQQLVARAYTQVDGKAFALPLQLPDGFAHYTPDPEVRLRRVPFVQPLIE